MEGTPAALTRARRHFADHCASCHGNDGRGETEMSRGLYPPAPDMTLAAVAHEGHGEPMMGKIAKVEESTFALTAKGDETVTFALTWDTVFKTGRPGGRPHCDRSSAASSAWSTTRSSSVSRSR